MHRNAARKEQEYVARAAVLHCNIHTKSLVLNCNSLSRSILGQVQEKGELNRVGWSGRCSIFTQNSILEGIFEEYFLAFQLFLICFDENSIHCCRCTGCVCRWPVQESLEVRTVMALGSALYGSSFAAQYVAQKFQTKTISRALNFHHRGRVRKVYNTVVDQRPHASFSDDAVFDFMDHHLERLQREEEEEEEKLRLRREREQLEWWQLEEERQKEEERDMQQKQQEEEAGDQEPPPTLGVFGCNRSLGTEGGTIGNTPCCSYIIY